MVNEIHLQEESRMGVRLVEEYRGETLENIHYGHICIIDGTGSVIMSAGDPEWVAYMRSAAKPFQAIPSIVHRVDEKFGLSDKEKTIMTASHRAEAEHVETLESMMAKIGIGEERLICAETYPLSQKARDELIVQGRPRRRLYHNCSGKHLGVLALCKALGLPLEGYASPEHPAQQEILRTIAYLAEVPAESIRIGVDGCGFPVFALPLSRIARLYLKLACPDLIEDADIRRAAVEISRVMNAHPDLVSASWFICSNLLRDPNIVAKGGAKGIYGFALRKERIAVALKVLDGSEEEWPLVIAAILEQLQYDNRETIERLYRLAPKEVKNDSSRVVGTNRVVFELKRH
jgi:L-asparaginase II